MKMTTNSGLNKREYLYNSNFIAVEPAWIGEKFDLRNLSTIIRR